MRWLTFKVGIPMVSGHGLRNLPRLAESRSDDRIGATGRGTAAVS